MPGFDGVFAVGDVANIPGADGRALPQLGSVAQQSGKWAGKNIAALIKGKKATPFHYHDKGIMAMIGRNAAVAEIGAHRHQVDGPIAFAAWLGLHAILLSGTHSRVDAFLNWADDYFHHDRAPDLELAGTPSRIAWAGGPRRQGRPLIGPLASRLRTTALPCQRSDDALDSAQQPDPDALICNDSARSRNLERVIMAGTKSPRPASGTPTTPSRSRGAMARAEKQRLAEADTGAAPWRDWGPYLSERAWGTVREDYSADGDAWSFFPHDHARSRVYRWNEDGMAGFCDETQNWCLSLGLWNGVDPILKERMFGLTGPQGNHGEDVKEYWWYLDGTPTHSWNTWRYHYPQREFPYGDLVAENARRGKLEPEYELVDTGIFDDEPLLGGHCRLRQGRPAGPADADHGGERRAGRGDPACAADAVVPQHLVVGVRRSPEADAAAGRRPDRRRATRGPVRSCWSATVTRSRCSARTRPTTSGCSAGRTSRRTRRTASTTTSCTAPTRSTRCRTGTKAALHYTRDGAGRAVRTAIKVRLVGVPHPAIDVDPLAPSVEPIDLGREFDAIVARPAGRGGRLLRRGDPGRRRRPRRRRWPGRRSPDCCGASSSSTTTSQRWLDGDPGQPPPPPGRGAIRNGDWLHLNNHEVILMPDPWEYPWFAAWDLAFHCVTLAHIDPTFAKAQLVLLLREWYMHPNGQIPAYEWNFSDVNPPVHAWAALRVFEIDGGTDFTFLARIFHKLLINFTWWVDNKDHGGNNLFQGGFMGLDNIAPLDRSTLPPSERVPRAGRLHRVDGDVRAGPAGHGAAAGHARPVVRGRRDQVLRALPGHRRGREQRRPVGRAGLLLLRRPAPAPTAPTSRSR